jgi:hypothetical protein
MLSVSVRDFSLQHDLSGQAAKFNVVTRVASNGNRDGQNQAQAGQVLHRYSSRLFWL